MGWTREKIDRHKGMPEGRVLMRKFARQVAAGDTPDRDLCLAIAELFGEVDATFDGGSPAAQSVKKALKLETGKGRKGYKSTAETWPQFSFCIEVEERRRTLGENKEVAIEAVAKKRHKAYATAERWHDNHGRRARSHLERMKVIQCWVDEQEGMQEAVIELLSKQLF